MGTILVPEDLEIELPPGWVEHPNPGGPRELRATPDGSTGILQVSRYGGEDFDFISGQADLGAFAAQLGTGLGAAGQNWGRASGNRKGTCARGRFGMATFQGGEYPAMVLWVTVSSNEALMWTWLGPSLVADELRGALQVVLGRS